MHSSSCLPSCNINEGQQLSSHCLSLRKPNRPADLLQQHLYRLDLSDRPDGYIKSVQTLKQ